MKYMFVCERVRERDCRCSMMGMGIFVCAYDTTRTPANKIM